MGELIGLTAVRRSSNWLGNDGHERTEEEEGWQGCHLGVGGVGVGGQTVR